MPPSTSSRKRPALQSSVQPSITSYFTSPAPTSGSVAWPTAPRTNPAEPPPSVKSSLLNVGMRVRKAVPEGLKSGTYKAQKFALSVSAGQDSSVLPQPSSPRKNKRELDNETFPSGADIRRNQPIEQPRTIVVPKSLTRRYHAAVPRSVVKLQDVVMQDQSVGAGEDFEEAGFLRPVS